MSISTHHMETSSSLTNILPATPFCVKVNLGKITDAFLLQISELNPHLTFETDSQNNLIITMPTHKDTGKFNFKLGLKFGFWNEKKDLGEIYDSSTGIKFPDGSVKSPDLTFILKEKLQDHPKDSFLLVIPDFVIELMSASDGLGYVQEKMENYMANGVRLAWLIYPKKETTYIYRPNSEVETKHFSETLSGEDVLPDFTIVLADLLA